MATVFQTPAELKGAVGKQLGYSDWLQITQERINQFADATGDHQWIHVDPERAKTGPYGACIAHGYLTLSLVNMFLPQIVEVRGIRMGINYGLEKVRFPAPVRVGSRIRGGGELVQVEDVKGGAVQSTIRITVEIEASDRPACVADTISRWVPE
ncbi:MAG: MaoC-like dehydratase [Deltaproteobacteria bacterium]|jgi:acyl dehydratase|nr:MaoC-like dehydratase [Deltaproteobacteria bacterium]